MTLSKINSLFKTLSYTEKLKAIKCLYQQIEQVEEENNEYSDIFVANISDEGKILEAIDDLSDILAYTKAVKINDDVIAFPKNQNRNLNIREV